MEKKKKTLVYEIEPNKQKTSDCHLHGRGNA